jgi:hypothetical protein
MGTTAISKHLYASGLYFPSANKSDGIEPFDALGKLDVKAGTKTAPFTPLFVPSYRSLLPEYYLTATQTETVIRDVAPMTTNLYSTPHGRNVSSSGGGDPIQTWMTEYNLNANVAPVGTDQTVLWGQHLTAADIAHFQAKALLRSLVSTINKGLSREYFYTAAHNDGFNVVDSNFIAAANAHPTVYPGNQLGGPTTDAFHNLMSHFPDSGQGAATRQLQLVSIEQSGNHAQFSGDGTAAHPDLFDREVLTVFPFQVSPTRFVIPTYVMTRDLAMLYNPSAPSSDVTRFDLPDETFRITLGNLPASAAPPSVSSYDPLHDVYTPARFVSRQGDKAVFELSATDYPRLLTLDFG